MSAALLDKGDALEELLRAYFLRAGFFVIRGVPFRFGGEDLTDVDLWLYERPTGTTRRIQICDAKYKQRPKAMERIFWTRGVADALGVDGAFVATTDRRRGLHSIAKKLNLNLIDGTDIQRIKASHSVAFPGRLTDEELEKLLSKVDANFRTKSMSEARSDILTSLSDGFGSSSLVRSLEAFGRLSSNAVSYHPNSMAARASGRLAFLAASIVCQSLDFVSVGAAFRSNEERRELMLNAVRYGALGADNTLQMLRLAMGLVEKYGPGGRVSASTIEAALRRDLEKIPAEIVADQAVKLLRSDQLFVVGRDLEMAAYQKELPSFDGLDAHSKSMIGALLDYAGVDRQRFAEAWKSGPEVDASDSASAASPVPEQRRTLLDEA